MARRRLMTVKDPLQEEEENPARTAQIERLRKVISAVNHDLRQPLQTMELLCGVLMAKTKDEEVLKINTRIEETLRSAISLLDTLVNAERFAEQTEEKEHTVAPVEAPPAAIREALAPESSLTATLFIVDDDKEVREAMGELLRSRGYNVELYESCEEYLEHRQPGKPGALLIDAVFPCMGGLDCLKSLKENKQLPPAIMITGRGDISLAVQAMKAGAIDFIEKPINHKELLKTVANVLQQTQDTARVSEDREIALARLARLSARERQVMDMVLEGQLNKNIAADLGISQRTVETHRANIMRKMEVKSLPALLRLTMAAA